MNDKYLPCPFCGSQSLRELDITLCSDNGERDVLAVECLMCDAQAPAEIWNERRTPDQAWQRALAETDDTAPGLDEL